MITTKSTDTLEDVLDDYAQRVDAALADRPAKVDLSDADEQLRRALSRAKRPEAAARLVEAGHAVAGIYARYLATSSDTGVAWSMAMGSLTLVEAADRALDEAAGTTLAAEPDDVARLVDEQKATTAALAAAVDAADVDAVMRLRPELEVRLPVKIAEAKRDAVTRRLAAVDASRARPDRRVDRASVDVDAAEQTVRSLADELKAAQSAHIRAAAVLHRARTAVRAIDETATALATERDRLDAELKLDQAQRLRRLAGLPEPQAAAPDTTPAMQVINPVRDEGRSWSITARDDDDLDAIDPPWVAPTRQAARR